MRSHVIVGLICAAISCVLSIKTYKVLNQTPADTPVAEVVKDETETRTIIRYVDKAGKPVEKETISTKIVEKRATPYPPERRPNLIGIQAMPDGKGGIKAGPKYGREIFPNFYVEGGVVINTTGKPEPAITGAISVRF